MTAASATATRLPRSEVGLVRLAAQRVHAPPGGAADVVRHLGAVQAQDLRAGATAVALRCGAADVSGVAAALAAGTVVRTWPMRGTLHLLAAEDVGWVLGLTAGRTVTATATRRRQLGLDEAFVERAREVAVGLLTGGRAARRADLHAAWTAAGLDVTGQRAPNLLQHLALTGTLVLGPPRGREQLVVLLQEWVPTGRRLTGEEALTEWARRYVAGHGPATAADFATWTKLPLTAARRAFAALRPEVEAVDVDGVEHLVHPSATAALAASRRALRAVHLLPGFDEFLLGYGDRSHVLAPEHVDAVCPGGNGIFRGTVVTAGQVVGTWVRERGTVAATPFTAFGAAVTAGVRRRAQTLPDGFLDEGPAPAAAAPRAPRSAQAPAPPTGGSQAAPL
ncbi:winged helix DNA-binding domain-containing protein [Kineococcus rubinsiae]|uniref:winged helix DNA-binding domain-containing protein n=1 Tax=Kineococcus rubinsiae TaxID=2609562 RepID=UPI0014314F41|nr:winged helix DNA-binding domain-containing protein [Kineococcus rubinsiae]NIZ90127.1 winged helix DNA-binding domain-containing protein [Kineococcus rubinsiae]